MKTRTVKDLMIPISEYKTIPEEALMYDAARALKTSQSEFEKYSGRPRTIVVRENNRPVGVVGQHELLKALEPRYEEAGISGRTTLSGFSSDFLRSMLRAFKFWDRPLSSLCEKAIQLRVKDFMEFPSDSECVDQDATLDEAIHQLIVGNHDTLFVMRQGEIAGMLRLVDVFKEVESSIEACSGGD